jgi:RimJ/RimL family protein N-acetyltransferase
MQGELGFRPVTPADRPMLASWIARPHWQRWWGPAEQEADDIVAHVTDPDVGPFFITLDGRDVGYIQWWRPDGAWDIPVDAPPATTRGIDLSIADPDDCNRGLGSRALTAFVARLAAEGVTRFLIDPAPDNAVARRAYARAGFVEVARGTHTDGPYVLMLLDLQPTEAE